MDHSPEDWQRLAEYVVKRRTSLGLTQQDVRAVGGPSTATMRLLEGALQTNYQPMIIGRLERALRWEPGSVDAILAGRKPTNYHEVFDTDGATATEDEYANAYDEFEPGSLIRRVEELIRRRKERELDQALKLVEGQVDRDAG